MANLDDPTYGLAHDLSLPANEVPAFNWITPNNCSDAHDASCQGNNLSGAFNANGTPNYNPAGLPADDPEATTPVNYTGGLYAADLFLRYYIPMIEQSAAFADGGLIDITFDEANPPFTIGNSFNNVPAPGDSTTSSAPADQPTFGSAGTTAPGANSLYGAYGLLADAAGENINGHNVNTEPTGPNDPEVTNSSGQQLQPGPGRLRIHRPADRAGRREPQPERVTGRGDRAGAGRRGLEHGDGLQDQRRRHRPARLGHRRQGQHDPARHLRRRGERHRADRPVLQRQHHHGVEQLRQAVDRHLPAAQRQRAARHAARRLQRQRDPERRRRDVHRRQRPRCPSGNEAATTAGCVTADPLFDPTDFTPGGGDTGTVLISPLIKPGTVSSTYYNHYSTLRTLEDLLLTGQSCTNPSNADTPLAAGTVCGGLDGQGHIGYAAQAGLATFGPGRLHGASTSRP